MSSIPARSEDRRVKRTKKILRECLFRLLSEKSIDEITVKELTESADVNRSTFYFYYKDINDMIRQIQDEIYSVFEKDVIAPEASFDSPDDIAAYILRFLYFCRDNAQICKFVISNDPNNNLTNKIKAALMERLPDTRAVFPAADARYYLTTFAVAACWQTSLEWLYDGMKVSPEDMAKFLSSAYFGGGRTLF